MEPRKPRSGVRMTTLAVNVMHHSVVWQDILAQCDSIDDMLGLQENNISGHADDSNAIKTIAPIPRHNADVIEQ